MPNREALSVLDEYEQRRLDKDLFRKKLHHLGGSFDGFYKHAQRYSSFKPLQCNQLLIERLKFILDRIRKGVSSEPASLEKLIDMSFIHIPCSQFADCRGHRFDPDCKHRK